MPKADTGDRDLLAIALDVHTTSTGAMERSNEDQEKDIETLWRRLSDWQPSTIRRFAYFDLAIYHLLRTVLIEARLVEDDKNSRRK